MIAANNRVIQSVRDQTETHTKPKNASIIYWE